MYKMKKKIAYIDSAFYSNESILCTGFFNRRKKNKKKDEVRSEENKRKRNKMINYNSCDDWVSILLLQMPSGI